MRDFLRRLDRDGERWLMLVFYSYIVMVIFIEVIRRFVLSYSSIWGEETARYAFIFLVWIGASAAIKERAHIRIDVLAHYLPARGQALLILFGDILTLALACIALYWSLEPVWQSIRWGSVTDGLRVTRAWFLIAVPFGFTLIALRLIQSIVRDIADLRAGREVYTGKRLFD